MKKIESAFKEDMKNYNQTVNGCDEQVVDGEFSHKPDVNEALSQAVAAIYFGDSSDYLDALWEVVRSLGGEGACKLLKENEVKAFHKYTE